MIRRGAVMLAALCLTQACASDEGSETDDDKTLKDQQSTPVNPNGGAVLGQGYNSVSEDYLTQCVTAPVVPMSTEPAVISLDQDMSEEKLNATLGVTASVSARYGLFSADARSSFQRESQKSRTSLTYVYAAYIPKQGEKLDENQITVVRDPAASFFECGDRLVQQKIRGGSLHFYAKIDFASEAEKRKFEASASGSYGGFTGTADTKTLRERFSKSAHVSVKVMQTGGRKEQLAQIFAGGQAGTAALACGMDNLSACGQFLANAASYASGDFANALGEGLWEDLSYVTADWADLGLPVTRPDLPPQVFDARAALLDASKLHARVQNRIKAIDDSNWFGRGRDHVDAQVAANIDSYRAMNAESIRFLRSAVPACYGQLSVPPSPEQIAACVSVGEIVRAAALGSGYFHIDEASLDIPTVTTSRYGRDDFVTEVMPNGGWYGEWLPTTENGSYKMCPAGTHAVGLSMRVEAELGNGNKKDDTALNAVELLCDNDRRSALTLIRPHEGLYGDWHPPVSCDGTPLQGIMVRQEARQGDGDDSAANDLKGICTSGQLLETPVRPDGGGGGAPGGTRYGSWGGVDAEDAGAVQEALEKSKCPDSSAVCGVRVRFESSQGGGDDTALNGISLACCAY